MHQRLVRDLQTVVACYHQPGPHERVDHAAMVVVGHHRVGIDVLAHRFAVGGRGDEAEQQRPGQRSLTGRQALVESLGSGGDGLTQPAGGDVALYGEDPTLTVGPRFGQREGQQRETTRFAAHVPQEELDQARLEPQARCACGLLDGGSQLVLGHGGDEVQPIFDPACEGGMDAERADVVGAQRDDDRGHLEPLDQRREELLRSLAWEAGGEELFHLVHHQHGGLVGSGHRGSHRSLRIMAGGEHSNAAARPAEAAGDAGANQGGLAAARRADHGEERGGGQTAQTGLDLTVASEVAVVVVHVVGDEPPVGAAGVGVSGRGDRTDQVGVLLEEPLLERHQFGTRRHAELVGQHSPGSLNGPERIALTAGAVQGQRQ